MKYFMDYQVQWLSNSSKIKLWEKSRQIGATYTQAFEDVRDCVKKAVPKVWFSSADLTAGLEYIRYCETWAKVLNIGFKNVGEQIIDEDTGIKAFTIEFVNGTEIHALSSNPKNFRSKTGKVILDEFAFHDQADELWKAAYPVTTWGYPLRILSTHNGKGCKFYKLIEDIHSGSLPQWYYQKTDIYMAVADGLADKISGRLLAQTERQEWIAAQRQMCGDDTAWKQEYECVPVDESTAFLTYEEIARSEQKDTLTTLDNISNDFYVGMDIARKKHLSVIWGMEKIGGQLITRFYKELENMPFARQKEILWKVLENKKMRRCALDATGLGMQLAEEAQSAFGKYRVNAVTFTGKVKETLAYCIKRRYDDNSITIPESTDIREDFHSVEKVIGLSGSIRFDVAKSDTNGHADRFWACALCCYAASEDKGAVTVRSGRTRKTVGLGRRYDYED